MVSVDLETKPCALDGAGDTEAVVEVDKPSVFNFLSANSFWLSGVTKVLGQSAGTMVGGGKKIVHHTTEGSNAAGAIATFRTTGSWPTLTAEWTGSKLEVYQHMPLNMAARALQHPGGTSETNRANCVQIEHVGFAADTGNWSDARYAAIATLCRQIESLWGVPSTTANVSFSNPQRLSGPGFVAAAGHCGHEHVPNNDHTDPGVGFKIEKILVPSKAYRTLKVGATGADVTAFQQAINKRADGLCRKDRRVNVDGKYGASTSVNGAWAAYILGIGKSQEEIGKGGISPYVQNLVRNPDERNLIQKARAGSRRKKSSKCK